MIFESQTTEAVVDTRIDLVRNAYLFRAVDKQGRQKGIVVSTYQKDGKYYSVSISTRNGQPFGGSNSCRYCDTAEQRDALVLKLVATAEKRAMR
jgi:hypothetical protein